MKNTLKSIVFAGLVGLSGCGEKPISTSVQPVKAYLESVGSVLLYDIDGDDKVDGIHNNLPVNEGRFIFVARGYEQKLKPFGVVLGGDAKIMSDHMSVNANELYRSIRNLNNSIKLDKKNKTYVERH